MGKILGLLILLSTQIVAKEKCSQVIISSHPNYPPFHWRIDDRLVGASIDISKQIFAELKVSSHVVFAGPWKRVLKSAKDEKIDFIPALKNTTERRQFLRFSNESFASNPVAVFMRNSDSLKPKTLNDLHGLFGSISAGDKHGEPIDSFLKQQNNLQNIHGIAQNFQMLTLKRTDYFIDGYYAAQNYLKVNNVRNDFKVAILFNEPKVHNAFSKTYAAKCPEVVEQFDRRLKLLKKSGAVDAAISKYNDKWLNNHH